MRNLKGPALKEESSSLKQSGCIGTMGGHETAIVLPRFFALNLTPQ